MAASEDLNC